METLLEVKNLRTNFYTDRGVAPAVDGLSYSIGKGELLCVVGESGSGKSVSALSVLRILQEPAGRVTEGEILFNGADILKLSEREMCSIRGDRISMIFQEPMTALNPVRSIGSQIAEAYRIHRKTGAGQAKERSLDMLRRVGLPSPERRFSEYPHQLSGGMRQRVMIAMALICGPELLIADEPTTALDVTIQAQILELMRDLRREYGMSVMLITHDLGVVSEMADKVMVMYAGSMVEYGSRDDIFSDMRHPYTIGLMESIPDINSPKEELASIEGMVPGIYDMPAGCKFAPRCGRAAGICFERRPDVYWRGGHGVRCFMYGS